MKKYIGYIRVSNKEHDTSIPSQELKLREYVQRNNIDLVKIYVEEKKCLQKIKTQRVQIGDEKPRER